MLLRLLPAIILIPLSSCGIPAPEEERDDLNPPLGLELVERTSSYIKIRFRAYNPEPNFSGYLIYMSISYDLYAQRARHIDLAKKTVNQEVEMKYIVLNPNTLSLPTIEYTFKNRITPQVIEFTITKAPGNTELNPNITYYIGVTAYDIVGLIESEMSNIIEVRPVS